MDNIISNASMRSVQEIPEIYRSLFAAYPCFNRVQSAVFDDIIHSNVSLVITAPTGSGKTVVFELAILKLMMGHQDLKSLKIVYVAPVKALCNERFNDWQPRFEAFNMSVVEVTGDSIDHCDLQDHQIIITTPEKWDSLTRRWRDNVSLVQMVKLVMIDEVHLLSDDKRGPILETIVCRMKTVMRVLKLQNSLRFIAVSATIFNIEDLAKWLGTSESDYKFHRFGQEVRPVTLNRVVKGYPLNKSPYLFDIQLSYKLKSLLVEYADGKPTLIFCSTRRGVVQTCKTLMENISFNFSREQILVLEEISAKIVDVKLKEYVRRGGAYHHAGMAFEDRIMVQNAFADGTLPVVVATSTLAMGVNLPAHLVIIKSTHQYIAGRIVEYSESSVLQMVGRAGRPQFDTTATAIIMTKYQLVDKYQNLLDCKEVIESSLHLHLPEQLNAEIVLLTIFDLGVAMQWIQCTFFYLRALKNPQYYGLSGNRSKIEKDLEIMVLRAINALKRSQLIDMNENGLDITPTFNGRLMSHYYINFNTFQLFFQITEIATIKDVIEILSSANELAEIQLRINDRRPLNELNVNKNSETIRFRLNGKIKTRELKINCLLQACLGCLPMDSTLQQESTRIINVLERIVKCLTEFLTRKNSYCSLLSSVILSKCLHAKLWENSAFVARQLDRIGATLGATLVAFGKTTFQAIVDSHPNELERIVNRGPPFGNLIIEQVRHLPMYSLFVKVDRESILKFTIHIKISIINKDLLLIHNTAGHNHSIVLIVGDTNNRLIMYKRLFDENILNDNFEVPIEIKPPMPQKIFVHVISEQWVGIDLMKDILINPIADIVVGSNCFLPNVEIVSKKGKVVEEKKTKEVQVAKKISKPADKKIVPKTIPNINNIDNLCCFDLVPDWIKNSPDLIEKNEDDYGKNQQLISANGFNNDMSCEVPDISSPIQSEFNHKSFIDNQDVHQQKSIISNYCYNTTNPNEVLCYETSKNFSQFDFETSMNVVETKSIVDQIGSEQQIVDESFPNFSDESYRNYTKNQPVKKKTKFEPEPTIVDNFDSSDLAINLISNADCFNVASSNDLEQSICTIESNDNITSFGHDFRDDKHIWPPRKSILSSNCDKNMLTSNNLESFNVATLNHFPENHLFDSQRNNRTSENDRYLSDYHVNATNNNNNWCYPKPASISITNPKIDNLFDFPTSNKLSKIDSSHDLNFERNICNIEANKNKISLADDFHSSATFDNNALYLPKPFSFRNISLAENSHVANLFNVATLNTENDFEQNIGNFKSDKNECVFSDNIQVIHPTAANYNNASYEPKYSKFEAKPKTNFLDVARISDPENDSPQTYNLDRKSSKFVTISKTSNLLNVATTFNQFPENVCEIFERKNCDIVSDYLIDDTPDNGLFKDGNGIRDSPDPSYRTANCVATMTQFPKNVSSYNYEFKSNICNIKPSVKHRNICNIESDNLIDGFSQNQLKKYVINSRSENNFVDFTANGVTTLSQFSENESNICYNGPSVGSKSSAKQISTNKMASDIPKLSACADQNKTATSWQVAEILTPINLNISSQNGDNKNINSIMSQIFPHKSLFNTQTVDPSETTTNWNEFEQNLLTGSQKKSKLSSFRDRFCYKKPNMPFVSQQNQQSKTLTQESNFQKSNNFAPNSNDLNTSQSNLKINVASQESNGCTGKTNILPRQSPFAIGNLSNLPKELSYIEKKINKENIPPKSLKRLFAVAQAAKKQSNNL